MKYDDRSLWKFDVRAVAAVHTLIIVILSYFQFLAIYLVKNTWWFFHSFDVRPATSSMVWNLISNPDGEMLFISGNNYSV